MRALRRGWPARRERSDLLVDGFVSATPRIDLERGRILGELAPVLGLAVVDRECRERRTRIVRAQRCDRRIDQRDFARERGHRRNRRGGDDDRGSRGHSLRRWRGRRDHDRIVRARCEVTARVRGDLERRRGQRDRRNVGGRSGHRREATDRQRTGREQRSELADRELRRDGFDRRGRGTRARSATDRSGDSRADACGNLGGRIETAARRSDEVAGRGAERWSHGWPSEGVRRARTRASKC